MKTQVINTVRACFAALRQIRSVRRSLPQHALLTLIRTLVIIKLDQCNLGPCEYLCIPAGPTAVRAECRRSACLLAPDVRTHKLTQPHCYVTRASLVTRPGTNPVPVVCSGVPLCAWHCTGVYTCLTACGRHQRSSLVDVSALLTPRHYKFRRLVGLPLGLTTVPFRWLQRVHGTLLPLETRACSSLLTFRRTFSHMADVAPYSDGQQTSALSCATVLDLDFVKCRRNCVMAAL